MVHCVIPENFCVHCPLTASSTLTKTTAANKRSVQVFIVEVPETASLFDHFAKSAKWFYCVETVLKYVGVQVGRKRAIVRGEKVSVL